MTLEEAITMALEYENKVQRTYQNAQKKILDPVGQRVFKILANEEQGHIDYLRSRLEEWQTTGKVTVERLDTAIPSPKRIQEGIKHLENHLGGKKSGGAVETELLQQAIEVEQETSSFYQKMVQELDEIGQALFARFVEIEGGHLAIVQAQLDAVTGLGFWFDMQEFQLEAG